MSQERKVELIKMSGRNEVWINGWTVPLVSATEHDGGTVVITLDGRLAITVDIEHHERVLSMIADTIAVAWGYHCHPRDDDFDKSRFNRVPHPSLCPKRPIGLSKKG